MQVKRFLQASISEQMAVAPVVIVEGARAVGKTWLLRELRRANIIAASFSLTDPTHLAAASENPLAWLRSLPSPFAIDEAQLLPELPLALKALLDETAERVQCVLTGSAAIGLTGLGGTDPLARRASRLTLEPLSEAELAATSDTPWSVIDQLFDGHPTIGTSLPLPNNWEKQTIRGGLPRYRIMNASRPDSVVQRQIGQDIKAILTEDVLPDEKKDTRIAHDVLTHLLMHPAGELNATAISKSIGIDARTVNRYIDILERRFLIDIIPNFHRPTKKSLRSTAKCYPADSALASSALFATDRRMTDSTVRGGMLEAHVVRQIKAHLGWATTRANITHWRENKNGRTSEVDVVLEDAEGRLVAIEVKASGTASSNHFKGIRALKNYYGERFHRGFVVTTGEHAVAFDKDLWAIPVGSLSHLESWQTPKAVSQNFPVSSQPSTDLQKVDTMPALDDAKIFISYSHQDQDSNTGGDIRRFATDVADALEGIHGRTVQLFLDVTDVRWGDDLWSRLDDELQTSTFLVPFITPRYLNSDGCRREFTSFSEAAQRNDSEQLLLPLIWISPPALKSGTSMDPIVERLNSTLYLDVTAARRADPGSAEYGRLVEEVAKRLEEVISDRETISGSLDRPHDDLKLDADPESGFDEYLANAEELLPQAQENLENFLEDFNHLGKEFERIVSGLEMQSPTQLRASMAGVSNGLRKPNEQLTASAAAAMRTWDQLITNLNRGLSLYSEINADGVPDDLVEGIRSMVDELEELDSADLEGIAHQMPKMSSKLAPTSKALLSAVGTLRYMETSLRSWLSALEQEQ